MTAMVKAARDGDVSGIAILAPKSNKQEEKDLALITASIGGHDSCIAALVSAKASVNSTDSAGDSAITVAAGFAHLAVVQELVKYGADANQESSRGRTPMVAAIESAPDAIPLITVLKDAYQIERESCRGRTALMDACAAGNLPAARALIEIAGARVPPEASRGQTALLCALQHQSTGLVQLLLEHTKLNSELNFENKLGITPLIGACELQHNNAVKLLIEAKAELDFESRIKHCTALIASVRMGSIDLCTDLVQAGASVNKETADGQTALMTALG